MDLLKDVNDLSNKWEDLSGKNNWEGRLNPLDADLRRYIIHYGRMAGACGDLFKSGMRVDANGDLHVMDGNGNSTSKISKVDFFQKACLEKGNEHKYKVTKFIEAASGTIEPAWFGYVAVSDGEAAMGRLDILIAWRGTAALKEWVSNGKVDLLSNKNIFKDENMKVHAGFLSVYAGVRQQPPYNFLASARDQVLQEVERLLDLEEHKNKEISITVTGFSLGSSLATINALDIVKNEYNKPKSNREKSCMVTAFVFGGPQVGNDKFKEAVDANNTKLHILRITNEKDLVPTVISIGDFGFKYIHVGKVLSVDSSKSTYFKRSILERSLDTSDPVAEFPSSGENNPDQNSDENNKDKRTGRGLVFSNWLSYHNMDVYLHAVAGFQGTSPFLLSVALDTALVNKHLDILAREDIPGNWWTGPDRQYMVQEDDGSWKYVKKN